MALWRLTDRMTGGKGLPWLLAAGVVLAVVATQRAGTSTASLDGKMAGVKSFEGGSFEASGVAAVGGADGVLFVDNARDDRVFWMRLSPEGTQLGPVVPVALGVTVNDPEAITTDGSHIFIVGSLSKAWSGVGLVRFTFDSEHHAARNVEALNALDLLVRERVPELRNQSLNVEALAWDPKGQRLLLGFREPVVDGQALVLPLQLRPTGALSSQSLDVGTPIRLPLGGAGLRSLEYDARGGRFLIVAETADDAKTGDYRLMAWSGPGTTEVRELASIDKRLRPEGVARATIGGRTFTFVVCDASRYLTLEAGG